MRIEPKAASGPAPAKDSPAKIADAAKQFEGLLIAQLLKSVSEASSEGWLGSGGDQTGSSAMELAQEQFATALSAQGGLGLTRMIVQGLKPAAAKTPGPAPNARL